ncbi:MAG: class I SAM-dependent methyltransferase [Burkholderiales bacterium]|nr:class I SAM-dependent methyltransferase [Burkholderiales bacterium]
MSTDLDQALKHYDALAPTYDRATRLINRTRLAAIARLAPQPGETVVDAGCGTGYCLGPLRDAVGESGLVIGFEPSASMLALAREKVSAAGWTNVLLYESEGRAMRLPQTANAWLFSYTHDLLQSREALEHLFEQGVPRARVAATGSKLFASWFWPGNAWVKWRHKGYLTDVHALEKPWAVLMDCLEDGRVDAAPLAQNYLASGFTASRFHRR